jgi:hypothetical protein
MDIIPQIVSAASPGFHNDNPGSSRRVVTSGAWKKQRVIVLIPAGKSIPTKVALAQWALIFPPNQPVMRMAAIGMEVGAAYSQAIQAIFDHQELSQWEYLLTMEHDNTPPADGAIKLIETMEQHPELTAVSGLYWTKGECGCPQIWGDVSDPVLNFRPQSPRPDTVQECCGVGMGFCLWRLAALRDPRLSRPLFVTKADASGVGTQDLYFWGNARKHGHRCAVDTRVKVGHYDVERDMTW